MAARPRSAMPTFIVESYGADGVVADQLARAERLTDPAAGIRHIRTTVVPADEVLLHLFEAPSAEVLGQAAGDAALTVDRIVEAIEGSGEP